MSTAEERIRGWVRRVVWACDGCGLRSACYADEGLPRRWVRVGDLVLCKLCASKRRRGQ